MQAINNFQVFQSSYTWKFISLPQALNLFEIYSESYN